MKNFISILILFYSFSTLASVPNDRHIYVEGLAQVSAVPDTAVVRFEVEFKMASALEAKNGVDKRINDLLNGLQKFRVDEKNVSASNITTQPNYYYTEDDKQEIDGYIANRSLTVTLNNIQFLNEFLDFALSVEVSEIRDIEFQSSLKNKLKKEAISLAVIDAKEKAESMAEAFGAKLGKVYSVDSENQGQRSRFGHNDSIEKIQVTGSRITSESFEPGRYLQENIVISARVYVVYDLEVE